MESGSEVRGKESENVESDEWLSCTERLTEKRRNMNGNRSSMLERCERAINGDWRVGVLGLCLGVVFIQPKSAMGLRGNGAERKEVREGEQINAKRRRVFFGWVWVGVGRILLFSFSFFLFFG